MSRVLFFTNAVALKLDRKNSITRGPTSLESILVDIHLLFRYRIVVHKKKRGFELSKVEELKVDDTKVVQYTHEWNALPT